MFYSCIPSNLFVLFYFPKYLKNAPVTTLEPYLLYIFTKPFKVQRYALGPPVFCSEIQSVEPTSIVTLQTLMVQLHSGLDKSKSNYYYFPQSKRTDLNMPMYCNYRSFYNWYISITYHLCKNSYW